MKKLISLVLVLSFLLLAGCNATSEETSAPETTAAPEEAAPPEQQPA